MKRNNKGNSFIQQLSLSQLLNEVYGGSMNNFATSDLYESAFIQANTEIAPGFETRDGWIYFIFPKNEVVTHAVEIFNEGGSVVAIKYANAIKRLRAEMLIRKNM